LTNSHPAGIRELYPVGAVVRQCDDRDRRGAHPEQLTSEVRTHPLQQPRGRERRHRHDDLVDIEVAGTGRHPPAVGGGGQGRDGCAGADVEVACHRGDDPVEPAAHGEEGRPLVGRHARPVFAQTPEHRAAAPGGGPQWRQRRFRGQTAHVARVHARQQRLDQLGHDLCTEARPDEVGDAAVARDEAARNQRLHRGARQAGRAEHP
jgi:hypothetical protein